MTDDPEAIDQDEARRRFGSKFDRFAETIGEAATEQGIIGYACIVMTEEAISVVSGGDPDQEWRATLRRVAGRVADELGQVLIARGVGHKPRDKQ